MEKTKIKCPVCRSIKTFRTDKTGFKCKNCGYIWIPIKSELFGKFFAECILTNLKRRIKMVNEDKMKTKKLNEHKT